MVVVVVLDFIADTCKNPGRRVSLYYWEFWRNKEISAERSTIDTAAEFSNASRRDRGLREHVTMDME